MPTRDATASRPRFGSVLLRLIASGCPAAALSNQVGRAACGWTLGIGLLLAGSGWAQDATPPAEASPQADEPAEVIPPLTPDVRGLLTDPLVFSGQITGDPVWTLDRQRVTNAGGLELIQLPVAVGSVDGMAGAGGVGEGGIKVSRSPVDVRGGRFVAWRLVEPEPVAPNAARVQRERARAASRQETGTSSYTVGAARRNKAFMLEDLDERERRHAAGDNPAAADDNANAEPEAYLADLPEGAPQLMRQFTLKPGGRLAYDLERRVPGMAFATGDSLYLILLDREKAEQLRPVRPERPARQANASREQRQQAELRYREELAKFRQESLEHRDLMRRVLDLPDEFEVDAPPRIYMVMERQTRIDTLAFSGPSPLPWELAVADLEALRMLAGAGASRRSRGGGQADAATAEQALLRVARQTHPFSQQLAAYTLLEGDLLKDATAGDVVENAALALLETGEPTAQRVVALAAARVLPPNSVSAKVLTAAATGELAGLGLASLEARLAVDAEGTEPDLAAMVRTASNAAVDPDGPDPKGVMITLFQAMTPANTTRRSPQSTASLANNPALLNAAQAFAFDGVPDDRRAGVIEGIVAAAPHAPLAAYWLDQTLLRSQDPSWFKGSLQTLAKTRVIHDALQPESDAQTTPPAPPPTESAPVTLDKPIVLTHREHGLLQALRSSDQATRELAWAALGPFEIPATPGRSNPRGSAAGTDPGLSLFMTIVADAIELTPTPPAVVAFAANQSGAEGTDALVSLMLGEDEQASRAAALALIGSEREIAPLIAGLAPAVRHRFADQVVTVAASPTNEQGPAARLTPEAAEDVKRVTGLMRQLTAARPGSTGFGVGWFCSEVSAGRVPTLEQWVDQSVNAQDPRRGADTTGPIRAAPLLALTATPDIVLAEAALTALTLAVGGDLSMAEQVKAEAMALPERTDAVMNEFWQATLAELIASKLADAAGPYRLVVRVEPPDPRDAGANDRTPPATGNRLAAPRSLAQRLTERAAENTNPAGDDPTITEPASPPATEIDLGILPLSLSATGQPSLGVDGLNLTAPPDYLAIRLEDVSTLNSFGRPEIARLPIEFRRDAIDLVPVEDDQWRGSLTLDTGERLTLELIPAAE
ncbi:MAG: hypothetical protein AAF797_09675 [Planctomycetota bacterium]